MAAAIIIFVVAEDAQYAFVEGINNGRKEELTRQSAEYIQRMLSNPICQKGSSSLMGTCWEEFLMSQ